jgi:DnaJ domain
MPDATPQQIKKAYYDCMKACHPDLSGNDPDVTNFCMFINEVYAVGLLCSLLFLDNIYFGKISCLQQNFSI